MLVPILAMSLVNHMDAMAEDLTVTATVAAPIPDDPPVIETPPPSVPPTTEEIVVSGSCPVVEPAIIVTVYRNGTFVGSDECSPAGNFAVVAPLVYGINTFVAKILTITGGTGETSIEITVTRKAPPGIKLPTLTPTPTPNPKGGKPDTSAGISNQNGLGVSLHILTTDMFVTIKGDGSAKWSGSITGGTAPYKVSFKWGDGKIDERLVGDSSLQTFEHNYGNIQPHDVEIVVTDAKGESTSMQLSAATFVKQHYPLLDAKVSDVHPIVTFIQKNSIQIYIAALSSLVFLWYLEHGRHILSLSKLFHNLRFRH